MSKHIVISTSTELVRIAPEKIVYITSDGNYSTLMQADGEMRMLSYQLGQIEEMIGRQLGRDSEMFVRIGRGHIINRFIDKAFAREQYDTLKSLFWKDTWVTGLKEYWDRWYYFGMDIDAGVILFELSPSGTAFFAGPATYFGDARVRSGILKTAEVAGHTVGSGDNRHYLLGNVALVGEAIMLAMRTHKQ